MPDHIRYPRAFLEWQARVGRDAHRYRATPDGRGGMIVTNVPPPGVRKDKPIYFPADAAAPMQSQEANSVEPVEPALATSPAAAPSRADRDKWQLDTLPHSDLNV